jgi:YVTN family beta-propeller protein
MIASRRRFVVVYAILVMVFSLMMIITFISASENFSTNYEDPIEVYVVNSLNNSVAVIKGDDVISTIKVGSWPRQAGYDPLTHQLFVSVGVQPQSSGLSIIDTDTNKLVKTITGGGFFFPQAVLYSPNKHLIYVSNFGANNVVAVDPRTDRILKTISVGVEPQDMSYNPQNRELYVSNVGFGGSGTTVSAINTTTNIVVATIVVGTNPRGSAVNPINHDTYVENYGSGTISVISPKDTVIATIRGFSQPWTITYNPSNHDFYVGDRGTNKVFVLNPDNDKIVAAIGGFEAPMGSAFNPVNDEVYVSNWDHANYVTIISGQDAAENVTVGPSPWGVAVG